MDFFQTKSPAKINLFLKVLGKKEGYHQLESLFAFLDLTDELRIEKSDQFRLEISGEFATFLDLQHNLFTKILDSFSTNFGISKNLHIKIEKNIPVAAGLGGGSGNAACFLIALNEIFALNLTKKDLQTISLNFGSDIPFFFENKAAIIRGRGEKITDFPHFLPIEALLINPRIQLSTKEVFARREGVFSKEISDTEILKTPILDLIKNFPNDLTSPAISILPAVSEIFDELKKSGAKIAKMSGSGASCFGIFSEESELDLAAENFTKKFPSFFVKKVKIHATNFIWLTEH